jgi:1-acyl-sn-glycerol-3-phosphate acyltransferase
MTPTYRLTWIVLGTFAKVWFRARAVDAHHVPLTGPVILASNHASFADPPLVGTSVDREISYLARDTLFSKPLLGSYIRRLNAVPVNREGGGGPGLKAILDRLNSGSGIILFPEGTRTHDGKLQPAKSGIGLIVAKSTAPVVPVHIHGSYEAWGRHHALPRPRKITVRFGALRDFAELRAELANAEKSRVKAIYQEIADRIMSDVAAL